MYLRYVFFGGILLGVVNAVQATDLQRLFTTPEERLQLNQTRERQPEKVEEIAVELTEPPEEEPPENIPAIITFNGLLKRSQGPTTVWINGSSQPVQEGFFARTDAINGDVLPIVIGKDKKEVYLKPGQTINTTEGQIRESFIGIVKVDKSAELD